MQTSLPCTVVIPISITPHPPHVMASHASHMISLANQQQCFFHWGSIIADTLPRLTGTVAVQHHRSSGQGSNYSEVQYQQPKLDHDPPSTK